MEVQANYKLSEQTNVKSSGEAKVVLDDKHLVLKVTLGESLLFSYTDILGIAEGDYKLDLFLTSKDVLSLSGLGYRYEDFLFNLYRLRNELLLKYLLMEESLLKAGFEARFSSFDDKNQLNQTGQCELRLYDTALLVLPQKNDPIRIPYCFVSQFAKDDYRLLLSNEFGERYEFSMLGEKFDAFQRNLSDAFNRVVVRSQTIIKDLFPESDPAKTHKLATLMRDGKAAKRNDIDPLMPELWPRITRLAAEAGLTREFNFLENSSWKEQIHVGIKRGLMGELSGDYIWFLFPLCDPKTSEFNGIFAQEAFSITKNEKEGKDSIEQAEPELESEDEKTTEGVENKSERGPKTSGRATYFFKIPTSPNNMNASGKISTSELDRFVKDVNRCMIDINFRREPIYLSQEDLTNPKYERYRYATARIASLKMLRDHFIGRVPHLTFDRWKNNVSNLLALNTKK
jgi:hypothetical protein